MSWTLRGDLELFGIELPEKLALDDWIARVRCKPCTSVMSLVAVSGYLFYRLERGRNPNVNDIYDAMIYTSTCLSVGYSNILACTPAGKLLGTLLMTLGPALAARALDGSAETRPASEAMQAEIVEALRQLLHKVEGRSLGEGR